MLKILNTLLLLVLFAVSTKVEASTKQCVSEEDLDFESCNLKDLSIPALEDICDRLGLNMESHMFPYLFDDDSEDGESSETKERTKEDYIEAAIQCLTIEEEMDRMMEEDPEALEALERQLISEDPSLLAEIVADILAQNPDLIKELEEELRQEDPVLFQEIVEELGEGQTLADRPEILAEIVALMLEEDPDLLEKLDEELDKLMAEHAIEDEDEDEDESDVKTEL